MSLFQALKTASKTDFRAVTQYNNNPLKYGMYYVEATDKYIVTNKCITRTVGEEDLFLFFMVSKTCSIIVGDSLLWNHKDAPAQRIQGAWRRYRLRTTRDRNDLALRGLAEYFGHPRFQDFSV